MKYDTPFASRFRALREAIPATQAEMAERLGITQQSVSFYEKGERLPDFYVLDRICNLTGCSLKYLFGYQQTMSDVLADNVNALDISGAKERVITQIIMTREDVAEVLDMIMRPSSAFWDIVKQLQILAGGSQERYFESPIFTSGYFRFLCHDALDELIQDISEDGYDTLSDVERQDIELRRQNLEKETMAFIKEMSDKYAEEAKRSSDRVKAFANGISKRAEGDKFKEFRSMLWFQTFDLEKE